jgi:hypothetical protein
MNFVLKSGKIRLYRAKNAAGNVQANFIGEVDPSLPMKELPEEVSLNITPMELRQLEEYMTGYRRTRDAETLQKGITLVVASLKDPEIFELPIKTLEKIESDLKSSLSCIKVILKRIEGQESVVSQ